MFKVTFYFERTYIKERGWLFHCNTGTEAKDVTFLSYFIIVRLTIRDHTVMTSNPKPQPPSPPPPPHPQK